MAEQKMTIKIEPSPALEQMLKRVVEEAVGKSEAGEVARLKGKVKELATRLNMVPTPGGPVGDVLTERLDGITKALLELAK
jgi:hypothetical protein